VAIDTTQARGVAADIQPVVSPPVPGAVPPPAPPAGPASPSEPSLEPSSSISFSEATPQELAAELNRHLDQALARKTPGGGARFVAVGKRGVSLRVTYEHPVAIGYRGILLKLYQDGSVEGAGALDTATPTMRPAR